MNKVGAGGAVGNSTLSGNVVFSRGAGGGIYNAGTLEVSDSTICGNRAGIGGGVYDYSAGTFVVHNSILAGNTGSGAADLFGSLGSRGHNLIGNTTGGSGFLPTDLLNLDPLLGPLQDTVARRSPTACCPAARR
jgi:hypothetical protein